MERAGWLRRGKEIMFAGTFLCRFEPALVRNYLWNDWCWLNKHETSCSAQGLSQTAPQCSSGSALPLQSWVSPLKEGVHWSGKQRLSWRDDADLYLTFVPCKVCAVSGGCSSCSFSDRAVTISACAALKMWVLWNRALHLHLVLGCDRVRTYLLFFHFSVSSFPCGNFRIVCTDLQALSLLGFLLLQMFLVTKDKSFWTFFVFWNTLNYSNLITCFHPSSRRFLVLNIRSFTTCRSVDSCWWWEGVELSFLGKVGEKQNT